MKRDVTGTPWNGIRRRSPLRAKKRWRPGQSAQSRRTRDRRFGPPEFRSWIKRFGCGVCGRWPVDLAHVVPRSRGGGWEGNIVPLCRAHHRAFDIDCNSDPDRFRDLLRPRLLRGLDPVWLPALADRVHRDWSLWSSTGVEAA